MVYRKPRADVNTIYDDVRRANRTPRILSNSLLSLIDKVSAKNSFVVCERILRRSAKTVYLDYEKIFRSSDRAGKVISRKTRVRIRGRVRQGLRLEKGSESRLGVRESRFPSEGGSRRVPRGTKGQPKTPERGTGGVEIPRGKGFVKKTACPTKYRRPRTPENATRRETKPRPGVPKRPTITPDADTRTNVLHEPKTAPPKMPDSDFSGKMTTRKPRSPPPTAAR